MPVSHGPLCLNAFPALGEPHGKHRHLPRGQGETALKALQGLVLVAVALSVPGLLCNVVAQRPRDYEDDKECCQDFLSHVPLNARRLSKHLLSGTQKTRSVPGLFPSHLPRRRRRAGFLSD